MLQECIVVISTLPEKEDYVGRLPKGNNAGAVLNDE